MSPGPYTRPSNTQSAHKQIRTQDSASDVKRLVQRWQRGVETGLPTGAHRAALSRHVDEVDAGGQAAHLGAGGHAVGAHAGHAGGGVCEPAAAFGVLLPAVHTTCDSTDVWEHRACGCFHLLVCLCANTINPNRYSRKIPFQGTITAKSVTF